MTVHHLNGTTLLLAIIGHLVGDYLLQNDWMALNKKRDSIPCMVHCTLWALAVCLFAGWSGLWVYPVLFVTHFLQDRTTVVAWWMDRIGQKQFRTGPCAPWSIIVVDNVWHIVTIVLVWRWLA
jgi:hypothetical protein